MAEDDDRIIGIIIKHTHTPIHITNKYVVCIVGSDVMLANRMLSRAQLNYMHKIRYLLGICARTFLIF